jgi:hypothetical protein
MCSHRLSIDYVLVNDNGDATLKSFVILPARASIGTKFAIDFAFVSHNGTGTGEILVIVDTVDGVPLSTSFLIEALMPGTYGERITVNATPDPDCEPTQSESHRVTSTWFC